MSSAIISFLLSYLLLYKYATLFVVIFLAAIIAPLPVSTVLVAAGAFSSQGYFNFWLSLLVAVVANVIGDSIAFCATRLYRDSSDKEAKREKAARSSRFFFALDSYFKKYAALTIILSRFTAISGSIVNFLAGFSVMPFFSFLLYDAIGNAVDTAFYIGFGYIVGDYWQSFMGSLGLFGWIALVLFLIILISKLLRDKYWKKSTLLP